MTVYRSKPQHVEAVQWTGDNLPAVVEALGSKVRFETIGGLQLRAGKAGAQGWVPVPVGHWIVHPPGDMGDIWPVEADYFAAKYELPDTP